MVAGPKLLCWRRKSSGAKRLGMRAACCRFGIRSLLRGRRTAHSEESAATTAPVSAARRFASHCRSGCTATSPASPIPSLTCGMAVARRLLYWRRKSSGAKRLGVRAACCRFGIRSLLRGRRTAHSEESAATTAPVSAASCHDRKRQQAARSPRRFAPRCRSGCTTRSPASPIPSLTSGMAAVPKLLCWRRSSASGGLAGTLSSERTIHLPGKPARPHQEGCSERRTSLFSPA